MKKHFTLLWTLLFYLASYQLIAADVVIDNLPKEELKKYNSLTPEAQAQAILNLQNMGSYDPEHTRLDNTGRFYFVEDSLEEIMKGSGTDLLSEPPPSRKVISDTLPTKIVRNIPILHSLPGSPNVIYLNFLGATITNSAWNDTYGSPVYLAQPLATKPNVADMQKMIEIWQRVTEHYAPWGVDVTTEEPTVYTNTTLIALLTRSVTVDGKPMPANTAGGVAYLDIFNYSDSNYYKYALVYMDKLGENAHYIAEGASHELGHNFGLSHEGTSTSSYWLGTGSGEISWACIMGASYSRSITKFCNGDYPGANNHEDQVQIITNHVAKRSASAGSTMATATPLSMTNNVFKTSGVINDYRTSNFYLLNNISGKLTINGITFRPSNLGISLCLSLRLYNANGAVIASSNNPQSCSATLTVNSLPVGNYYVEVYPVGNTITPFPLYGSMGQYDLTGTTTPNSFSISPPYRTLALNSRMNFDAYDTAYVSGGVPPYTFFSTLNSFIRTGTTNTYVAGKTGIDTITVIDSKGNATSAQVTISQMDFGGMYGNSKLGNFNNPITGTQGCPTGYSSQQIMGTTNVDYPLYYCFRMHKDGVPSQYDFGGIYSGSNAGTRVNPVTGAGSCPAGYTSVQVYGENSHTPDYPVNFCYKVHNESIAEAAPFAGMYAPAAFTNYTNPITGWLSCPPDAIKTMMLGTTNVDYPFYFCTYKVSTIKLTPQYSNLALNDTLDFSANDNIQVSGGTPPYTYVTNLGTLTRSGNTFTYTATKPGLATILVTDAKADKARATIAVAYMDFGGMYGNSKGGAYNNPITGAFTCPSGYTSQQIMGTDGVDYPLFYCYRKHKKGLSADFDFGGMYSNSSSGLRVNPITGAGSCPLGYSSAQVYGQDGTDYPAYMCYKTHVDAIAETAHFGGMYAPAAPKNYDNPATGSQSCPSGWLSAKMLDTTFVDYAFYFCY